MRVYRCVPGAFARHVRALSTRCVVTTNTQRWSASLRFEQGAARSLSTTSAVPTPSPSSSSPLPSAPDAFRSSERSPGFAVLQTLAEWTRQSSSTSTASANQTKSHTQAIPAEAPPTLAARNRVLRKAIEKGDFVRAQQALEALVLPWDPARHPHPVDTENYDRLLFQWSEHCRRAGGDRVDLAPMLALLEAMVEWGRVNARSFNTALAACQRVRALEAGERVLEMMKRAGRQPKAFAYTTLISCCAQLASKHKGRKDHFVGLAERFFQELVEGGTGVTIEAVNSMVFAYRAGRGRSREAVELVERARREWHLQPDSRTIAPLVVCLLKDKNALEASRWIEFALKHHVTLDDSIIRSLLDECRRQAQWDKVDSIKLLLQEYGVAQQDRGVQNVLRHGRVRDAESDATPSVLSGRAIDWSLSKKKHKNHAATMLKTVIERIEQERHVHLTTVQWNDVFEYGSIDELDKLMRLLHKNWRHYQRTVSFKLLNEMYFRALGFAGQWWRIVRELDSLLLTAPTEVDVESFNAAIRGCTRCKRLHEAMRVFERMDRARVKPNRQTYDALLRCCGSVGSVESAVQLFHEMERFGIKPGTPELNTVLKSFATAVQRLVEASRDESIELQVPASDLNKLAIHSFHFYEDVRRSYDRMKITEGTLLHLFRSFLGAAEVFDAVDIHEFEAFASDDDHSDHESQAEWILLSNAVQLICREAPLDKVTPRVVNVGIDFFQRRGDPDSAFELFNTMISRGISPTPDTIRLLFAACYGGDQDAQLGLFFLDHLLADMNDTDESKIPQAIASESLRWAGRMTSASRRFESELVDVVLDKLSTVGVLKDNAYSQVMAVFGHDGNVVQAQRIAERMLSETGNISITVANRLTQACSVARMPIAALNALGWMQHNGLQPDLTTYNNVLSAIRRYQERNRGFREKDSSMEDEEDVVDEVADRDDGDVNDDDGDDEDDDNDDQVVDRKFEEPRHERLSRIETDLNGVLDNLLADMNEEGVLPNARTFECLVTIARNREEMKRVLELFDMIKTQAQHRNVEVSALLSQKTIHHYLDGCKAMANAGDVVNAASRVEEISVLLASWHRERGYVVSASTLVRLLDTYDTLGQWQDSIALVKNAKDEFGVAPNVDMFRATMETCNHAGQHKVVEQIFATMQNSGGPYGKLFPTAACYIEAIYALEQQGNWIQATQLFMEMQKKCSAEDLHPSMLNRIALGRYAEGRKRFD